MAVTPRRLRSVGLATAAACALVAVAVGCHFGTYSDPNDPLHGQRSFAIEPIQFNMLMVGDKPEPVYLGGKKPEQQQSWQTDKSELARLLGERLARVTGPVGIMFGPPMAPPPPAAAPPLPPGAKERSRGPALQPSCMLECGDGMSVDTQSEKVQKAQDGVLEFLLINHPLDCPVCDKGGECPLQDTTVAYGPGESRWVEEKRHYEKPISISENVYLDRVEWVIIRDPQTQFNALVAGEVDIVLSNAGNIFYAAVEAIPLAELQNLFAVNTFGALRVAQAALPRMRARGRGRAPRCSAPGAAAAGCRPARTADH